MAKKTSRRKPRARNAAKRTPRARVADADPQGDLIVPESIVDTMSQDELDRALATGQDREALEDYFGPELYRELSVLAGQVQRKSVRGGPPVAILPGIMGSELSLTSGNKARVIWLNYLQVFLGRTQSLRLDGGGSKNISATGVLERYYTKLRLRLRNKGYDARFIPFDWRKSLGELGAALLSEISEAEKGRIHLVCHSMGGLVARAAALKSRKHFDRIIQLGTPNFGSLAPVTAMRGANSTARKVAALDASQDLQDYIRLFASFPGLLEMIPNPGRYPHGDLFDRDNWPANTDPAVSAKALAAARAVQKNALAGGDEKFWLIAGVDQETIVRAELDQARKEFTYFSSTEGDGTVPLALALLDDVKTYFVAEEHGALPNNTDVAEAVDDILRTGATDVLPSTRAARAAPREKPITETQLIARLAAEGTRATIPTSREQRHLLEEFLSVSSKDRETIGGAAPGRPPASEAETAPSELSRSRSIVVGRKRQGAIEINLAFGSITEADARAIVLGIYEKVIPSGAAKAVDQALDGAVGRYVDRRIFNGGLGEITVIPASRRQLRTEFVVFTGLGSFDQFSSGQLQTIGANLARMLVDTSIEDVAMVPFGGGAGFASDIILRNFLTGFLAGLRDADTKQGFRRLTICEIDRSKYTALVAEVLELTTTGLFDDFETTVDQIELPQPRLPATKVPRATALGGPEPIYLIARRYSSRPDIPQDKGDLMECSILGGGTTAAILSDRFEVDPDVLDRDFRELDEGRFSEADLKVLGKRIADEFVGSKISGALAQFLSANPESPLIVLHDAGASRIPWEALRLEKPNPGEIIPALQGGLSRRYLTHDLSVGKWLSARIVDDRLDILLIVNPTEDLPGAEEEGHRVEEIVSRVNSARLTKIEGAEATKDRLQALFQSGDFDVVHYAGHAFFDPEVRHRSGILCAGGQEVLSGMDLAGLVSLPALVVCNACQSGQIRGAGAAKPRVRRKPTTRTEIGRNVSFAESFLRGGIANYVGTHWSVGDAAAKDFAQTLYTRLADGDSMNTAVTQARQVVRQKASSKDWADYIHYGDPDFVLKAGVD
jgi:pimeloyl-ACP methyl ester carboxylesterase